MMGGGIAMSPGVVVGAAGIGVVDVEIVVGVGADEGIDSTTPSSWTVGHGGDVALGGCPSWTPVRRRRRARVDDSIGPPSLISRPHIRIVVLRRHHKHPLAFVGRGYGQCTSYSQWDCSNGER